MLKIYQLLLLVLIIELSAKKLNSPYEVMKYSFGPDVEVVKKNIILKKSQALSIQKSAKVKLNSKIFRYFKAVRNSEIIGYGILINRKVRSKNAVVLYMIDTNSTLKGIEIIAFNEPEEYITSKKWNALFEGTSTQSNLYLGKGIPTITGATLSARTVTDGSRIASAFYNEVLKK